MAKSNSNTPRRGPKLQPDEGATHAFLSLVLADDIGPHELRLFKAQVQYRSNLIVSSDRHSSTIGGYYTDPFALVADAKRASGVSLYLTVNPALPACLARADNRLISLGRDEGTHDNEIARLAWLYIDCDSKRITGVSANQEELAAGLALRDSVLSNVPGLADASLWGCSGNGGWILTRIDLANEPEQVELCRTALKILARRHDSEAAHIDPKTFNPSRVMCLPGTVKTKGENHADRPWRLVTMDSQKEQGRPEGWRPGSFDLPGWAAENRGEIEGQNKNQVGVGFASSTSAAQAAANGAHKPNGKPGRMSDHEYLIHRARKFVDAIPGAISGQNGHDQTYSVATALIKGFGLSTSDAWPILLDYNARCVPVWSDAELRHKLESADGEADDKPRGYLAAAENPSGHHNGNGYHWPEVPRPYYPSDTDRADDAAQPDGPGSDQPAEAESRSHQSQIQARELPDDPHRLARVVRSDYLTEAGQCRLAYFRDEFYAHDGTAYRLQPDFRAVTLVNRIKREVDQQNIAAHEFWAQLPEEARGKEPHAIKVTRSLVGDVGQALAAMTSVNRDHEPPFWKTGAGAATQDGAARPAPINIIPVSNGLLDVSSEAPRLLPHTPDYFCVYSLPYPYNPEAPAPANWLRLLQDQWGADRLSIDTLHEQFGYLLTPDTALQRIFLWIGPPRSGRGTIKDVLTALIGPLNVAATSPVALGNPFGLESLLNKTVAILGDARTSDTHDTAVMVDRLLRISGCDPVEVNRKGRSILSNVTLPVRFVIISNEMPLFRDASNAITARYSILKATRTIPLEDRIQGLAQRITTHELSGILNLAIEGLHRLRSRGRFIQPESALDLLEDAEDIASPARAFVQDCLLVDPEAEMPVEDAFALWRSWAISNGHPPGNISVFGKNLRAACPKVRKVRPRGDEGEQVASYQGIAPNGRGLERMAKMREKATRESMKRDSGTWEFEHESAVPF